MQPFFLVQGRPKVEVRNLLFIEVGLIIGLLIGITILSKDQINKELAKHSNKNN